MIAAIRDGAIIGVMFCLPWMVLDITKAIEGLKTPIYASGCSR